MTLPKDVAEALAVMDDARDEGRVFPVDCWQTIRAHLLSQDATITNLRSAAQKAVLANADLRAYAAAADALLRKCRDKVNDCMHDYGVKNGGAIVREIDAHLSEPRT